MLKFKDKNNKNYKFKAIINNTIYLNKIKMSLLFDFYI